VLFYAFFTRFHEEESNLANPEPDSPEPLRTQVNADEQRLTFLPQRTQRFAEETGTENIFVSSLFFLCALCALCGKYFLCISHEISRAGD